MFIGWWRCQIQKGSLGKGLWEEGREAGTGGHFAEGTRASLRRDPSAPPLSVSLPTGSLPLPTVFGPHPLSAPAWLRAGMCLSEGSAQVAMGKVNVGLKTFFSGGAVG